MNMNMFDEPWFRVQQDVVTQMQSWDTVLWTAAQPIVTELLDQPFARLVGILPWMLRDIFPLDDSLLHTLGVAHVFGWIYYATLDATLDGDLPRACVITGQCAWLAMIKIYQSLALPASMWHMIEVLTLQSAVGYTKEQQSVAPAGADYPRHDQLRLVDETMVTQRAAAFFINSRIQCFLAQRDEHPDRVKAVWAGLEALNLDRQYTDDATDWRHDLGAGYANLVGSFIVRFLHARSIELPLPYNADVIAGWLVVMPEIIEQLYARRQAIITDALRQVDDISELTHFALMLHALAADNDLFWQELSDHLYAVRTLFLR